MRTAPFVAALVLLIACVGAPTPEPAAVERATALVDRALTQGQAMALLRELVTVAPHRLSGSEGAARAVEWAKAAMERAGLERVRLEPVQVPRWERGSVARATVLRSSGGEELAVLALGGSVATPAGGVEAEVVMVRGLEEMERLGEAARGRIVFFNRPMPRALLNTFAAYGQAVDQRGHGAVAAGRAGGVAALVRSMTTAIDDFPHTGSMEYDAAVPRVPAAAVSTRGAERLAALLAEGPVRLRLELDCRTHPDVTSHNVLGELRGREKPEEIVLVGGHLDAWDVGQGAHDDGCGVVQSIEALRLLRVAGIQPRRTIRAVLFMNEENGLRGARAYAEAHKAERHYAAVEADRGGFEPKGFDTTLRGPDLVFAQQMVRGLEAWGMGAMIPGGGGADIAVLKPRGVPLFGLITASHRYFDLHHSDRDRIDQVNERELALGAAAMAWIAWQLAER